MLPSFFLSFREALQCALLLALAAGYPSIYQRRGKLLAGAGSAFVLAALIVYIPYLNTHMPGMEHWITARYITESVIFYLALVMLVAFGPQGREKASPADSGVVFALGFFLLFFEARSIILFSSDMASNLGAFPVYAGAVLGLLMGFGPLVYYLNRLPDLKLWRFFSPASLLVTMGALKFIMGGVGEVEEGDILIALQQGLQYIVENGVNHIQGLLLIGQHKFIPAPFEGLADYLRQDRASTALTVLFVMTPPLLALVRVFSRPDPEVSAIEVAAERRLKVAFFRRQMLYLSSPILVSFILLMVSLHAVNSSVNPLVEPDPMPVMESEAVPGTLQIPLVDRLGDFTDGKLRKYVYYFGNSKIMFLSIMKSDGTVGLGLDECEVCKPAEWNTSAQGYAQRGENLVCKYCMTPIAVSTLNEPGGCNPIPVPFSVEDDHISLRLEDLIRVHKAAKNLDKKGTHF